MRSPDNAPDGEGLPGPTQTPVAAPSVRSAPLQLLLERVEKAEGADWRLMMDVARTVYPAAYPGGWVLDPELADWRFLRFEKWVGAEAWEQAALALVERTLPDGLGWTITIDTEDNSATIRGSEGEYFEGGGVGKDPLALAVVEALLRALLAQETEHGPGRPTQND